MHEILQLSNHNLLCSLGPPNQGSLFVLLEQLEVSELANGGGVPLPTYILKNVNLQVVNRLKFRKLKFLSRKDSKYCISENDKISAPTKYFTKYSSSAFLYLLFNMAPTK